MAVRKMSGDVREMSGDPTLCRHHSPGYDGPASWIFTTASIILIWSGDATIFLFVSHDERISVLKIERKTLEMSKGI